MSKYEETTATLEIARSYLIGIQDDLGRLEHNVGAGIAQLDKAIDTLVNDEQTEGGVNHD